MTKREVLIAFCLAIGLGFIALFGEALFARHESEQPASAERLSSLGECERLKMTERVGGGVVVSNGDVQAATESCVRDAERSLVASGQAAALASAAPASSNR
jgi:hypothetical protein